MELIMTGDEKVTDDILDKLDNTTVNETRWSVLYNLAMSFKAVLIIEAARALGDHGIMGAEYPSVMSFYQFALHLANARENSNTEDGDVTHSELDTRGYHYRPQRAVSCSNGATCPSDRCPYNIVARSGYRNNCFGLCGYGCSCWSSVCGDCCVHEYCLTHDDCCSRNGFWSWSCLSVTWKVFGSQFSKSFRC